MDIKHELVRHCTLPEMRLMLAIFCTELEYEDFDYHVLSLLWRNAPEEVKTEIRLHFAELINAAKSRQKRGSNGIQK